MAPKKKEEYKIGWDIWLKEVPIGLFYLVFLAADLLIRHILWGNLKKTIKKMSKVGRDQ